MNQNKNSFTPKTDWKASWIWADSDPTIENQWVCFRKSFNLEKIPENLIADIAVDSRYWLYLNGEPVVFEGGLKRGPTNKDGYYESVDLTPFLKEGNNTISVLVWYWGSDESLSNIDSGQGGFLFEALSDEIELLSDSTWKAIQNPAYQTRDKQPNYRLPEFNIYYDAQVEPTGFIYNEFNDSNWSQASELAIGGSFPWNDLYPREIPQLKDSGYNDYLNNSDYIGVTTSEDTVFELDLPSNIQFTPYLKISAPSGKEIKLRTDTSDLSEIETTYITKDGEQEFESLNWVNGEKAFYEIPEGVTILDLKYHETSYNSEVQGSFECNDEFFNSLWQKSLNTLKITMRDNYMDCPDREKAQWFGDITTEMKMALYSLDSNANLLYEKAVNTIINWDSTTSILQTTVPSNNIYYELPMQNLAGIYGFLTYYQYTGDKEFLESVYDKSKDYVLLWDMDENGLVNHREGSWDFADWGEYSDVPVLENSWYYLSLKALVQMSEILNRKDDLNEFNKRINSINEAFPEFWTENGFKSSTVENPDDRANAMVVLAGLYNPEDLTQKEIIKNVLTSTYNSSPYMERYVLDALSELGYMNDAQTRIKTRYNDMVNDTCSTLWEYWDKSAGTKNHAWSGSPLLTLSEYVAGISPLEPGYKTIKIKPQLGELTNFNCKVPTPLGLVSEEVTLNNNRLDIVIEAPENSSLEISLPTFGKDIKTITLDGQTLKQNNDSDLASFVSNESDYLTYRIDSNQSKNLNFKITYSE